MSRRVPGCPDTFASHAWHCERCDYCLHDVVDNFGQAVAPWEVQLLHDCQVPDNVIPFRPRGGAA